MEWWIDCLILLLTFWSVAGACTIRQWLICAHRHIHWSCDVRNEMNTFLWYLKESIYGCFNTYTAKPVYWREWISDSYCSLKPLCSGMGGSSAGSYLADPTSPIPFALCFHYPVSKCCSASIAVTGTVRVKAIIFLLYDCSCSKVKRYPLSLFLPPSVPLSLSSFCLLLMINESRFLQPSSKF